MKKVFFLLFTISLFLKTIEAQDTLYIHQNGNLVKFATAKIDSITFKTNATTDIDGNIYHYLIVGTQTWMVENLRTTKYRNGDPIPDESANIHFGQLISGAFCNDGLYGNLYNWYAVADSRKIAPVGWHVATHEEWDLLRTYLGDNFGLQLKSQTGWLQDGNGTNSSGLNVLPGGFRTGESSIGNLTQSADFWTATEYSTTEAWSRKFYYYSNGSTRVTDLKAFGFSVRCVKD